MDWARPLGSGLKSVVDYQQSTIFLSTSIKTLWPTRTATSFKERHMGGYYVGLTIPAKISCPNTKNWKKRKYYCLCKLNFRFR